MDKMINPPLRAGDFVSYVYAQPGNDTTYGVVREIRATEARWYDPFFKLELWTDASALRPCSERELAMTIRAKPIRKWLELAALKA